MNTTNHIQEYDNPLQREINELRTAIRATIALAKHRASTWKPRPCPPRDYTH